MRDAGGGPKLSGLAILAGGSLAVMIDWNSALARYSNPLFASWTAHGIGAASSAAGALGLAAARHDAPAATIDRRGPLWERLGGIPGALTVLLAAITVNGPLGLPGTIALLLVGQIVFGIAADAFGWFGLQRRRPTRRLLASLALVLAGAALVIGASA